MWRETRILHSPSHPHLPTSTIKRETLTVNLRTQSTNGTTNFTGVKVRPTTPICKFDPFALSVWGFKVGVLYVLVPKVIVAMWIVKLHLWMSRPREECIEVMQLR